MKRYMKGDFVIEIAIVCFTILMCFSAYIKKCEAEELVVPQAYRVVDQAGVLAPNQIKNLATELKKASNHVVISILIVPTTNGEDIFAYSMRVFDEWKLGGKGKDNGILIAIATKDRKLRITTGYGTEGSITDAYAKRVIEAMTPALKQGDYYNALLMAVSKIDKKYTSDEVKPIQSISPHEDSALNGWIGWLIGGFAALFIGWITWVIIQTNKEERENARRLLDEERARELRRQREIKDWARSPIKKDTPRTSLGRTTIRQPRRIVPDPTPAPKSTRTQDFVSGAVAGVVADEVARSLFHSSNSSSDSSSSSDNSFSSSDSGGSSGGGGASGDY